MLLEPLELRSYVIYFGSEDRPASPYKGQVKHDK